MNVPWFKPTSLSPVSPIDINDEQWQWIPVDLNLTDEGKVVPYSGTVLRSVRAPLHLLDFVIASNPLMQAIFVFPFWVTDQATITIESAGQTLAKVPVQKSATKETQLNRVTVDLTSALEVSHPLPVRVQVSFGDSVGQVSVPLEKARAGVHPELAQTWTFPYWVEGVAYFASAWLTIQAVLLIVAAHLPISFFVRDISMLGIAFGWFAGLAGLPELTHIPVRMWLRRAYGRIVIPRRRLIVPLIALLATALLFWEGEIIYCVLTRVRYASLLKNSDHGRNYEDIVIQALVLVPDRIEAQLLLSRHVWGHRATDPARKKLLDKLAKNSRLRWIVTNYRSSGKRSRCLDADYVVSDPCLWLASLLPEADALSAPYGSTNALRLLAKRSDFDGTLLKSLVQWPLLQREWDKLLDETNTDPAQVLMASNAVASVRSNLIESINHDQFSVSDPQLLQEAADQLAQDAFRETHYSESLEYFRKVLDLREHHAISVTPSLRPPQKLMLYYVLGSVGDSSNKTDYIHRVASQYFEVPEFAKALTGAWSRVYVQQGNDKWNQGTVLGPEWASGSKMIGELLEKGWRF